MAGIEAALAARSVVDVGEVLEATTPLLRCPITFVVKERLRDLGYEDVVVVTKLGWLDPAALLRMIKPTPMRSRSEG